MKGKVMIQFTAMLTTALTAGLFFSWSCSVIPGLRLLPDSQYISVMQSINREIQNPAFFTCFFGAFVLLPFCVYSVYKESIALNFWLILLATLLYWIGVMGVTVAGNVPLNEWLDTFDLASASSAEIAAKRASFEEPWNKLNSIRTIAASLSLVLLLIAYLNPEKNLHQ